jgi:hypothetical protein
MINYFLNKIELLTKRTPKKEFVLFQQYKSVTPSKNVLTSKKFQSVQDKTFFTVKSCELSPEDFLGFSYIGDYNHKTEHWVPTNQVPPALSQWPASASKKPLIVSKYKFVNDYRRCIHVFTKSFEYFKKELKEYHKVSMYSLDIQKNQKNERVEPQLMIVADIRKKAAENFKPNNDISVDVV